MAIGVGLLEIEQDHVEPWQDALVPFPRTVSTGLDDTVQTSFTARLQQSGAEFHLQQRFAARECHTAVGGFVEGQIPQDLADDLCHRCLATDDLKSLGTALLRAPAAHRTRLAIDGVLTIDPVVGTLRAGLEAEAAVNTLVLQEGELLPGADALGVVAPLTSKRTALEEDSRADSRSVMDGEPLDVEDPS
jgi:hypothetical protein